MSATLRRTIGILVILCVVLGAVAAFLDEPLRIYAERAFNRRVAGYTLAIGKLDFHPIGLSVDFENVRLVQNEHPEPPVVHLPQWHASIHWGALLHGHLVSDHRLERPVMRITRPQMKKEAQDETALEDRGWQEAVLAVYPFKVDVFTMIDADIAYRDNPRSKPLHLDKLNVQAENIRNVQFTDRTYPSTIHLDGRVFDSGRIMMDGAANFLAEPHLGLNVDIALEQIRLEDIVPITGRANVQLRQGVLSTKGHVEYSPVIKQAILSNLILEGVRVDYVHSAQTKETEKKAAKTTAQTAEKLSNHPEWLLRIDQAKILDSELGFVNEAVTPPYRVYLTDANIGLDNFSNQLTEGTAYVKVTGKFMGSGLTQVSGTFRPERDSPDFDLQMRMVKTKMRSLNDVLRAYGNFDVVKGVFSFFTELTVKNGTIHGYVKPLFKDVDVYDSEQDQDKALVQQLYEGVVGGTMSVLENRQRNEVATQAELSGPVKSPTMSTWQVIAKLIQNAFFKAILPGLAREAQEK
ncbi:MAG: DUF748 domain-containing protein [Nitrospirales bacterium]|nr:DUF748 domain-containing protein [Nitrospirales bacterium]